MVCIASSWVVIRSISTSSCMISIIVIIVIIIIIIIVIVIVVMVMIIVISSLYPCVLGPRDDGARAPRSKAGRDLHLHARRPVLY